MATKVKTEIERINPILTENIKDNVQSVEIEKINLWEGNTRIHTKKSVEKLSKLIDRYGLQQPIVVWKKNMVVYSGNGRLLAAKLLGWKFIDVKWADFINEIEAEAFGTAANKSQEWSEWNADALREQFSSSDLKSMVEDKNKFVDIIGFTSKEIDKILLKNEKVKVDVKEEKNIIRISCPDNILKEFTIGLHAYLNGKGWRTKGVKVL